LAGLNPADKIKDLGSRTFFLCSKETANESCRLSFHGGETFQSCRINFHGGETAVPARSSLSSYGREIQNISRITEPWYNKLIGWLLPSPE